MFEEPGYVDVHDWERVEPQDLLAKMQQLGSRLPSGRPFIIESVFDRPARKQIKEIVICHLRAIEQEPVDVGGR